MTIHYSDIRRPAPRDRAGAAVFHADPDALLGQVDFVSLHMPARRRHRPLPQRRPDREAAQGAVIINSARGTLIDDEALIAALKSGRIAAAGLDVYANEPNLHPGYLALENVCLLPHLVAPRSRPATPWASARSTISTPSSPAANRPTSVV